MGLPFVLFKFDSAISFRTWLASAINTPGLVRGPGSGASRMSVIPAMIRLNDFLWGVVFSNRGTGEIVSRKEVAGPSQQRCRGRTRRSRFDNEDVT
jgi:hypothetical protein